MMELDFDKEIDALLRKEGAGRTITISEFSGMHLDADEIAAFAEGAVPPRARTAFTEHFAACDQCRKTLSNLIVLNAADDPEPAVAVVPGELAVPWYRRLLLFPNLAYVMGGLVVLFAGFIGLSIMTQTFQTSQSDVSQISENRAAEPERVFTNTNAANMLSTGAAESNNNSSMTANTAANAAVPYETSSRNTAANSSAERVIPADRTELPKPKSFSVDGADITRSQPAPAAPPPPVAEPKDNSAALDGVVTQEPDRKAKTDREQAAENQKARTITAPAGQPVPASRDRQDSSRAVMKRSAPAAGGGNNSANIANKKEVSGKSFEFRQGAWYDTTYRGQGTINVRRNSDEYRKLDQGLRGIADSFIGTVVTLWNGKAYRIQ